MVGRYYKRRKRGFYTNIPVPPEFRHLHGGKPKIEVTLRTRDEETAAREAGIMARRLHLQWQAAKGSPDAKKALERQTYQEARRLVLEGSLGELDAPDLDEVVSLTADAVLMKAERSLKTPAANLDEEPELPGDVVAKVRGLSDGLKEARGNKPAHRGRYEGSFKETADKWLEEWARRPERRQTNTQRQYEATIRMFAAWWGNRTVRAMTHVDAAEYVSHLRSMTAAEARTGKRKLSSTDTRTNAQAGLSTATVNRHVGTLKAIWSWAKKRGLASGDNPWDDLREKLTKRNQTPYVHWEPEELQTLLVDNRPKRQDLYELCLVALYSGMRISEIADMTWGQLGREGDIWFFRVEDAKTEAGNRRIPVHSQLSWLTARERGKANDPIWPTFNPEGPSKSRGDDASRAFGDYKRGLGFTARRKAFHSFRKNVTRIMEMAEIPPNIWARIIGHEPGFTYGKYNPDGLTLAKAKEIIERISYGDCRFATPL